MDEMTEHFISLGERPPIFFKKGSQLGADGVEYTKAQAYRGLFIALATSVGNAYIQTFVSSSKDRLAA